MTIFTKPSKLRAVINFEGVLIFFVENVSASNWEEMKYEKQVRLENSRASQVDGFVRKFTINITEINERKRI